MDYASFERSILRFKKLKTRIIGRSEDGRKIYSLSAFFDPRKPWVIMQGAVHAREHLSADFVLTLASIVEHKFELFKKMKSFPNICFVPMVNPDGVEIVCHGIKSIRNEKLKQSASRWISGDEHMFVKSNARGVDINNNFDAMWDRHQNSCVPSLQGFIGTHPFSESETRALRDVTLEVKPIFSISFHLKGEEIYWDFFQKGSRRKIDKKIAKLVSKVNGYAVKSTENSSSGGYKDWCVQFLEIPSLTIELGRDELSHPVEEGEIYDIIAKNIGILDVLCDIVRLIEGER